RVGEQVAFTLRLRNTGSAPVTIGLTGITPAVDFIVDTPTAQPVWNLLHGVAIPMVLQFRTLAPKEVLDLSGVWTQRTNDGAPVGPGSYRVKAVLATDRGEVTAGPHLLTLTR
ncbi:MAG TPA: BsuPI-related putative proteinase inhibitor, partial [Vicinamibacterales bacterium]|nr:BsuPI-related putative proteinase inhibitor [Vicinamibacterales bacterium]